MAGTSEALVRSFAERRDNPLFTQVLAPCIQALNHAMFENAKPGSRAEFFAYGPLTDKREDGIPHEGGYIVQPVMLDFVLREYFEKTSTGKCTTLQREWFPQKTSYYRTPGSKNAATECSLGFRRALPVCGLNAGVYSISKQPERPVPMRESLFELGTYCEGILGNRCVCLRQFGSGSTYSGSVYVRTCHHFVSEEFDFQTKGFRVPTFAGVVLLRRSSGNCAIPKDPCVNQCMVEVLAPVDAGGGPRKSPCMSCSEIPFQPPTCGGLGGSGHCVS